MKKQASVVLLGGLLSVILLTGCSSTIHNDGWVAGPSNTAYDNQNNLAFVPVPTPSGSPDINAAVVDLQSWIDANKDKRIVSITWVGYFGNRDSYGFLVYYELEEESPWTKN